MPDPKLQEKALNREFKLLLKKKPEVKKRKAPKLIIGDALPSTSSFVKEQTIKLNPKAGERGTGPGSKKGAVVKVHSRTTQQNRRQNSSVSRMGGRHY